VVLEVRHRVTADIANFASRRRLRHWSVGRKCSLYVL
jgi:hypothetical protein